MPVTDQQARAIAFLAIAARPYGARRWDEAGVLANIKRVADRSLAAVVIAVMQAAEDREAHTPGVIPKAGPHWRTPESAPLADVIPFDRDTWCHTCSLPKASCRTRWADDHEFESVTDANRRKGKATGADSARKALTAVRADLCPHGVKPNLCAEHRPAHTPARQTPAPTPGDDREDTP